MHVIRNTSLVILAIIIDGAQAIISAGIAVIAAFPLATGGCVAGSYAAGQLGCWTGSAVLGLLSLTPFGALANAAFATITIPVGLILGIAINMCLSFAGGAMLFLFMKFYDVPVSLRQMAWAFLEGIPGVNNVPFWTFFTLSTLWKSAVQEGTVPGVVQAAALIAAPTRGVMSLKEQTMQVPGMQQSLQRTGLDQYRVDQPTWDASPQRSEGARVPLHDIRPAKTNAQTA